MLFREIPGWTRVGLFVEHARSLNLQPDPGRRWPRLRELAADGKIPARMIDGFWHFENARAHEIGEILRMVRIDRDAA